MADKLKTFTVPIADIHSSLFFFAIRKKRDVISLLMNTIKYVRSDVKINGSITNRIHFIVDDMNRIFFESPNKIFSIRSPFNIREENGELIFYTNSINNIDHKVTSEVLSFILDERFESTSSYQFLESFEDNIPNGDELWSLIKELLIFEDGYIRFDHDPENENGRQHPLNHLDICYSRASTFKIGTHKRPCINYLKGILDNKVNAEYLERGV